MTCQIELSDRTFDLLDTYARTRGVNLDEAVERAVGIFTLTAKPNGTNGNGHNGTTTSTREPAKPLLTFRLPGELGRSYEHLRDEIELGTCDEIVRQMEQDFARLLLKAYP